MRLESCCRFYILLFGVVFLSSCSKETLVEYKPHVYVLFSTAGLGDLSYNDNIMWGLSQSYYANEFKLTTYTPHDLSEASLIAAQWKEKAKQNAKTLIVLADNSYEDIAREVFKDNSIPNLSVALFQSRSKDLPVNTYSFSYYGASYMLGLLAGTDCSRSAIIMGCSSNFNNQDAANGFADGFRAQHGIVEGIIALSDKTDGFAMPNRMYELADSLKESADYIFPIAGGSNFGIYRYLREYPCQLKTAGVDVDMSKYCDRINASLIIRSDLFIQNMVERWLENMLLPSGTAYGLGSDYLYVLPVPAYEATYDEISAKYMSKAIQLEKEYENRL